MVTPLSICHSIQFISYLSPSYKTSLSCTLSFSALTDSHLHQAMAEKISTIIIKVDLECQSCYKKIRKTLCKLQERERIRTINYDEKSGKVTISGPFDPKKLAKKLCCKACNVIKEIEIVEEKPKEKEKEKEKPKDAKSVEQPKPNKEKPKDSKPTEAAAKPKDSKPAEKEKTKPAAEPGKEKTKPAAEPAKAEKEKPKQAAEPALQKSKSFGSVDMHGSVYQDGWPAGPICWCGPGYEAYYGGCRCCACGRTYGWVAGGPPGDGYKPCHFFSEEDPSAACNIM